jgi:hypothetical protein
MHDNMPSPFDTPPPGFDHGCEYAATVLGGCKPGSSNSPVFTGWGSRSCNRCATDFKLPQDAPCDHRWDVTIKFSTDDFSADFRTFTSPLLPPPGQPGDEPPPPGQKLGVSVSSEQLREIQGVRFTFDLQFKNGTRAAANLLVCSCPGGFEFSPLCDDNRSPYNGAALVQAVDTTDFLDQKIIAGSCARGKVTNCKWEVDADCTCPGSSVTCLQIPGVQP